MKYQHFNSWEESDLYKLIQEMKKCPQTKNQSVWDHGTSVKEHLFDLIAYLKGEKQLENWRLPDWLETYRSELLSSLPDERILENYAQYHDCGKPFCREIDSEGKQHFPDHANVSRAKWLEVDKSEDRFVVADLIAHDMDIHLMKAADLEKFCENKNATSLLLTGLAEIHSNAAMFGGIESTSFIIKYKQIEKRGKQVCQRLFGIAVK